MTTSLAKQQLSLDNGFPVPVHIGPTPMQLIEQAIAKGLDADQLGKLMDLQMRWQSNEARKEFVESMMLFKQHTPEIIKSRTADFGSGKAKYEYAPLDEVVNIIIPALNAVGISHRWEPGQNGDRITMTCVLTHKSGHSERATLEAPPDQTGSKNSVQAVGSTVTYLQRYTLLSACGLAVKGQDSDAQLNSGWIIEKCEWIDNCRDLDELKKVYTAAYKEAQEKKDKQAMSILIEAKDKKRKELEG